MTRLFAIVVLGGLVAACDRPSLVDTLEGVHWVDLSYAFDSTTIYWPTARPFRLEVVSAQRTPAGFYYAANNLCAAEHGGTHLDSPIHFGEGRQTTDEIPLARLTGPAVVVDVTPKANENADYLVAVQDLRDWEMRNGDIPRGAILLLRSGWGARWPDRVRYLGTTKTGPGAVPELHFPGLDSAAARWLVEQRRIDAVGIDTPSIDYGQSTTFMTHRILAAADIPIFENVARLDQVPITGAYVIALPMKIARGSGGPLRIVAALPP